MLLDWRHLRLYVDVTLNLNDLQTYQECLIVLIVCLTFLVIIKLKFRTITNGMKSVSDWFNFFFFCSFTVLPEYLPRRRRRWPKSFPCFTGSSPPAWPLLVAASVPWSLSAVRYSGRPWGRCSPTYWSASYCHQSTLKDRQLDWYLGRLLISGMTFNLKTHQLFRPI